MLTALLTVALAFDPIPKSGPGEGKIALFIREPSATLVLITPSGSIEKRVDLGEIKDVISTVRLFRNGHSALIISSLGGNENEGSKCWLVDLTEKNKPKPLFERKSWLSVVPHDDGLTLIASEPDREKIAKKNPKEGHDPIKSWTYEIASGKTTPLALPDNQQVVDVSSSTQTALVLCWVENEYRTGLHSFKTGKTTLIENNDLSPLLLSANGRTLLTFDVVKQANGTRLVSGIAVYDIPKNSKQSVEEPDDSRGLASFSLSPDGQRVCFVANLRTRRPNGVTSRLYFTNSDGSNAKIIYEAKQGELLGDCDWR